MRKRTIALLAAGSLIASIMAIGPASAQAAPMPVPSEPNIVDPPSDSNGLNDQGDGSLFGDNPGGVNFVAGDYLDVWFTTTDTLNVHIHTTAPGGGGNWAIIYRVFVNDGCDAFQGTISGKSNLDAAPTASIRDFCARGLTTLPGEIKVEPYEDGTGLTTLSFPLGQWPGLELGSTLTAPYGTSRIVSPATTAPQMDTTAPGTDYTIAAGGEGPPAGTPGENPPPSDGEVGNDDPNSGGPNDEQPVKNGCKKKKGKGKKKGCKKGKGPKPASCDAYVPGERGAEAETIVVTEEATEAAPIELEMAPGPAIGLFYGFLGQDNPLITHDYINIQVDTSGEPMGLYARVEFSEGEDQDIFLRNVDDSIAAQAAGGNQAPAVLGDGTGTGGHSEATAEQLDGVLTPDCGGYTFEDANAFGFGESVVKLWLGPATWDPVAQAPIG